MPTQVDLCNRALSLLQIAPIQAVGENTNQGIECETHYEPSLLTVLRDHPWNFCSYSTALGLLTDSYQGWDYAYQYPSDCVRALEILPDSMALSNDGDRIEFEVRLNENKNGQVILTDQEDAYLLYVAYIDDPNQYDGLFIDAFTWLLAANMTPALRGDLNLQAQYLGRYQQILMKAQLNDSAEGREDPDSTNTFVKARE